jgi:undecaprenyl diphosphate synthase
MAGHRAGAKVLPRAAEWCRDAGVEVLSVFCFSTENWNRPPAEVNGLLRLFDVLLRRNFPRLLRERIRLRWLGRPEGLPDRIVETLRALEKETAKFCDFQLCLAINYGGRDEMVRAVRRSRESSGKGPEDWPDLARLLDTADLPEVDLLIRTSGERRISNFLPLQSAYAELYFTDCLWPDFSREELRRALEDFGDRRRSFGTVAAEEDQDR